jgi:hypothetical protein
MKLDSILREGINTNLTYLQEQGGGGSYVLAIGKRVQSMLEQEALRHSLRIEYPEAFKKNKHRDPKKLLKRRSSGRINTDLLRLQLAWDETKGAEITEDLIKQVNGYILGEDNQSEYRNDRVRIAGSFNIPPAPEKLEKQMGELISEYTLGRNATESNPSKFIELAALMHLHLTRIHPFSDGNGRTARIIQNKILADGDLPPAIIPAAERSMYMHILEQADKEWKYEEGNTGPHQNHLCDYIGSKVHATLEKLRE